MSYPVPLLPPDVLWLSHGVDLAERLEARLRPQLTAHGYDVRRLSDSANPLARAQAVFHDLRTLLRETGGGAALWALANGHKQARIVALAERPAPHATEGCPALGLPPMASRWRVFTLHAHLISDWPDIADLYCEAIAASLDDADIAPDAAKLARLQAEADDLRERGRLPAPVDVRRHVLTIAPERRAVS